MILFSAVGDPSRDERLEGYLKAIADDDMTSLRLLYEETGAGVFSFALSMLKNREDAEDVLHDVYLSVHNSAHLYKPMGRPMEWLMTVTRNLCLSKLRQRRKQTPLGGEEAAVEYFDISKSDERIALNDAMQALTDEERRIVTLHAAAGLKHREIGAVLDMPPSTVRTKYHRALKKLKKMLSEGGENDG